MDDESEARRQALLDSINLVVNHLRFFSKDFYPQRDDQLDVLLAENNNQISVKWYDEAVTRHYSLWPADVLSRFMFISFIIANEAALQREDTPNVSGKYLADPIRLDGDISLDFESMFFSGALRQYAKADPILRAKIRYVERHRSAYVPYENLIYTFLGPNTFEYLSASSMEGKPKLQPHEASRVEWIKLFQIDSQVRLDGELRTLGALNNERAKDLVAAAWTLAALMAFMSPSVFPSESEAYVSSVRKDGLTVSSGGGVRVIPKFKPSSLIDSLDFLRSSINDPAFEAVDLMWIALALTQLERIDVPYGSEVPSQDPRYRAFLSHRGMDAKTDLLSKLLNDQLSEGIFLDCLHPSLGCVNRLFVFRSVVHSQTVYIIHTSNYSGSTWCLKEQRLAEYLSEKRALHCYKFKTIEAAWDHLVNNRTMDIHGTAAPPLAVEDVSLGPLWFIYRDFNKEDRTPNRKTLSEYPDFLVAVDRVVSRLNECDWKSKLKSGSLATMVGEAVQKFFEEVCSLTFERVGHEASLEFCNLPVDALVVLGQITFGVVSVGTRTSSKVESRQAVDSLGRLVTEFVTVMAESKGFHTAQWRDYFLAMIIAKALQFDREQTNQLPVDVGLQLCGDVVTLKGRQVLFDVRERSKVAEFRLRLASMLIRYGIGTTGIVQSALDTVHDKSIDCFDLSVLPCITIYPGMAGMLNLKE